ncbi:hypothetical protein G6038_14920 [Rhodococcus sp. 14C212]|uniref:hypothetical protein n=1 Tax=Rhodococcus sp. 14C212 TaxID=2711209 RepID=UPI0013EBE260|nr:hypothetical protein [Rhodococcus sp. 14C212]NGP06749.1 hypothetical protein [Rhodococcus sp. 14C212]
MDDVDIASAAPRVVLGSTMIARRCNPTSGFGGGGRTATLFESAGWSERVHVSAGERLELTAGVGLLLRFATALGAIWLVGIATSGEVASHRRNGFLVIWDGDKYVSIFVIARATLAGLMHSRWLSDDLIEIDSHRNQLENSTLLSGRMVAAACWYYVCPTRVEHPSEPASPEQLSGCLDLRPYP